MEVQGGTDHETSVVSGMVGCPTIQTHYMGSVYSLASLETPCDADSDWFVIERHYQGRQSVHRSAARVS